MFNNEDLDASAPGLSAPGYRSLLMGDCITVIMMYVYYVAYVRSLGNNSFLRFVVVWERRRLIIE